MHRLGIREGEGGEMWVCCSHSYLVDSVNTEGLPSLLPAGAPPPGPRWWRILSFLFPLISSSGNFIRLMSLHGSIVGFQSPGNGQ